MSEKEISPLPPDAVELLSDPELAKLRYRGAGIPKAGKTFKPAHPPAVGESPFLILRTDLDYARKAQVTWVNKPSAPGSLGRGNGFPSLRDARPRFTADEPKPAQSRGAWHYAGWLIGSPKFVATMRSFDTEVIKTVQIDWTYSDGRTLDGYVFLDVTRLLHAYDYRRSVVNVEIGEAGKYIASVGAPAALKHDLPAGIHVFREAHWRHDVFCSRALAKALLEAEPKGFYFEDPARRGAAQF